MKLTEHFSVEELSYTDHREFDNTPNAEETANLERLALLLEEVRALLNKPIIVNSAFRSEEVNKAVGSKPSSQHRLGCAADIRVPGVTPDAVVKAVIAARLPYDQIIREFDRWTHISVPNTKEMTPRRQALIIDKSGTRVYA